MRLIGNSKRVISELENGTKLSVYNNKAVRTQHAVVEQNEVNQLLHLSASWRYIIDR